MIDDALTELGEFGEVRLIVTKGRLRFVVTQQSYDALQWEEDTRNGGQRNEDPSFDPSSEAKNRQPN